MRPSKVSPPNNTSVANQGYPLAFIITLSPRKKGLPNIEKRCECGISGLHFKDFLNCSR